MNNATERTLLISYSGSQKDIIEKIRTFIQSQFKDKSIFPIGEQAWVLNFENNSLKDNEISEKFADLCKELKISLSDPSKPHLPTGFNFLEKGEQLSVGWLSAI